MEDERQLTVKEASELSGMSRHFVRAGIMNGTVPGAYIKEREKPTFYIPRKAFVEFLEHWHRTPSEELIQALIKQLAKEKVPAATGVKKENFILIITLLK